MNAQRLLDTYERICETTGRMREAAHAAEWDRLLELERTLPELFARVKALDDEIIADGPFRTRKAELIRRVLDNDAAIRSCIEPRLAELQLLLGNAGRERVLTDAYSVAR